MEFTAGALIKQIGKLVGSATASPTGSLSKQTTKSVGGATMSPGASLTTVLTSGGGGGSSSIIKCASDRTPHTINIRDKPADVINIRSD